MVTERISSTANPRVKAFARLKKARERAATGLFLIEGLREVERALAAGVEVETVLACPEFLDDPLPQLAESIELVELTTAPMAKLSVRQNPAGLVAVARQFDMRLDRLVLGTNPLVLIAERVEKPGNLGAMMRTADAVGADAVVIADSATDVFNPNVVRASQGALFLVPLAAAASSACIAWARAESLQVVGGYPDALSEIWDVDLTGPTAVLVGAEDTGISAAWDGAATRIQIPMAGASDSLNASVSAAVMMYEAVRQRRRFTPSDR
ncbi:MAG: RNA methyltransferase [Acidimicrobiia bacterium]|nr:RNA methyltransferase [Acidimicrobiia bacterium]